MARKPANGPTDGELEILNVLWERGPSGLGDICKALRVNRPIATTTVATVLKVMLEKKLVARKRGPRGYQWSANCDRRETAAGMIQKLVDRVFDGSARRLAVHLVEAGHLSEDEQNQLRELLENPDQT